jgi:hypothetical protein
MAKGKVKRIANLKPKFGSAGEYLFMKVQSPWSRDVEEYWLFTDHEYQEARKRAYGNKEDMVRQPRGVYDRVDNTEARFGSNTHYICVLVEEEGVSIPLMLTEVELERVRQRVENNAEDIEENREGWLADFLD